MTSAAHLALVPPEGAWTVTRDGDTVAVVAVKHEGGGVVVDADLRASASKVGPHRFPSLAAAEAFVNDLIASFTYLGCDVARA